MQRLVPVVLMYEDFFGLRARPFGITPSVDLFFHSSAHRRTLAYLERQVLAGEPVIVLTGNIGAGKTTVLQALLRNLPDKFAPAIVVSTQLDQIDLTRTVLLAFGAAADGALDDLRNALRSHLEDLRSRGSRGLLVVDEAQNFSAATLSYLMQLPQLGGADEEPLLQVVISGQPGLHSLLVEVAGGEPDQELPLCRLGAMSTMDTGSYVRHRLRVVGTAEGPTFSEDALDRVRVATGGLPRLVNRLCERVLMSAYLDQTRNIDATRVERAAAGLREEMDDPDMTLPPRDDQPPMQVAPPMPLPAQPGSLVVAPEADPHPDPALAEASFQPPAPPLEPAPAVPLPRELPQPAHADASSRRQRHYWPAAAAAGLLAVSLGWLAYDRSSPQNTARLGAAGPAKVVAPASQAGVATPRQEPEVSAPVAESSVAVPQTDGQSRIGRTAKSGVLEPMPAPSRPVDARAALGLANSGETTSTPSAPPPATAPACTDAAKALGLCP